MQEGAEDLAGVGFLLSLAEALGEINAPEMWRLRREP